MGIAIQVGILAVLSRLLGPNEFGLMLATTLAMRFVSYFARAGLGESLIRLSTPTPAHCSAAFVSAIAIGGSLWILMALSAVLVAEYFRAPELVAMLRVVPAAIVLGAVASVPLAILRRTFRFKAIAFVESLGLTLGYGAVAVVLATNGYGVWSLVAATIAQQAIVLGMALSFARLGAMAIPARTHFADVLAYGSRYSIVGFLDFLSSNVESLFIGRFLGMGQLGTYNRVIALTSLPVEQVMAAVQRVSFPAMARLSEDQRRLQAAMRLSVTLVSLVTFPAALVMVALSEDLVRIVLGPGWQSAIAVVQVFALAIPALHISVVCGSTLDVLGAFRAKGMVILGVTVLKLLFVTALGASGLVWVAGGLVVTEWGRALALTWLVCRNLEVKLRQVLQRLTFGLVIGLLTAATLSITLFALGSSNEIALPRLWNALVAILVASMVFVLGVRFALRRILGLESLTGLDLAPLKRLARI